MASSSWVRIESGLANIGLAERLDVVNVDDSFLVEAIWNDGTTCVIWRGEDEAGAWRFIDEVARRMALHEQLMTSRVGSPGQ
jgi:hypothetical protein